MAAVKYFIAAFCLVTTASASLKNLKLVQTLANFDPKKIPNEVIEEVAEFIGYSLLSHVQDSIVPALKNSNLTSDSFKTSNKIEINVADPLRDNDIPLNSAHWTEIAGGPSSGLFVGDIQFCDPMASGFASLGTDFVLSVDSFIPITATANLDISATLDIHGRHSIGAAVLFELLRIKSFGYFIARIRNTVVNVNLKIDIDELYRFRVYQTALDIDLERIDLHADSTVLNDQTLDWIALSQDITDIFKDLWPIVRTLINKFLSTPLSRVISKVVGRCGIDDILEILTAGDGEVPACFKDKPASPPSLPIISKWLSSIETMDDYESCKTQYDPPPKPVVTTTPAPTTPEPSSAPSQFPLTVFVTLIVSLVSIFN